MDEGGGLVGRNRSKGGHVGDSPTWSVSRAARTAVEMRDDVVDTIPGNNTLVQISGDVLTPVYKQMSQVFADRGYSPTQARSAALSAMDMYQMDDGIADAAAPLAVLSRMRFERDVETLRQAQIYVVSPAMHATIVAACSTLTVDDLALWTEGDLPSLFGLLVFPGIQSFYLNSGSDRPDEFIAVSWRPGVTYAQNAYGLPMPRSVVFATTWEDTCGPVKGSLYRAERSKARENGDRYPAIAPLYYNYSELDSQYSTMVFDEEVADVRSPVAAVEGEFSGEAIRDPSPSTWTLRYLMAFSRLVKQKVATPERFSAGIDGRSKPRPHHDVRVVQLRSYSVSPSESGPRDSGAPSYNHRWVVKMHKVNQWYPREKVHKILWRGPYIKGPENAPLLTGEKVQALVR